MNNTTIEGRVEGAYALTATAIAGLANGHIALLGDYVKGSYDLSANVAISDLEMVLVSAEQFNYEAGKLDKDYVIVAGGLIRVYVPRLGLSVSFHSGNFDTATLPAVGKYIVPVAGATQMKVVDALGGTEAVAFKIDEVFNNFGQEYVTIRCIKL
jgi:hypothetical protein